VNIAYLKGDATDPFAAPGKPRPTVLVHIVNDAGGWGKGFVLALSKRWPNVESEYRKWYAERETNDFSLGAVQYVEVFPPKMSMDYPKRLWVANMVGQHGVWQKGPIRHEGPPPIRYDALRQALSRVGRFAAKHNARVVGPRFGTGLAGGDWHLIEPIIRDELLAQGIPVTIYDL
jgi:O-acetyl-ADP-ribose deacetylase (regulator of RNase III)